MKAAIMSTTWVTVCVQEGLQESESRDYQHLQLLDRGLDDNRLGLC